MAAPRCANGKVAAVGEVVIALQKTPKRKALALRTTCVEIQPPQNPINYKSLKPIKVQGILASEENPPDGVEPVCWLLLTTLFITGFEDVVQCRRWYSYRWLIEGYHYVLKSGCRARTTATRRED